MNLIRIIILLKLARELNLKLDYKLKVETEKTY